MGGGGNRSAFSCELSDLSIFFLVSLDATHLMQNFEP